MKPIKRRIVTVAGIFLLVLLLILAGRDYHYTNAPYVTWKWGITPYRYSGAMRFFGVDQDFRASLVGKTLPQMQKLFPVLVPPSRSDPHQRKYSKRLHMSDQDFRWIGSSDWVIQFHDGRVSRIDIYKG